MFRAPILITAALAFAFGLGYLFLAVRGCSAREASRAPPRLMQSPID
jgi:hypothetical protein